MHLVDNVPVQENWMNEYPFGGLLGNTTFTSGSCHSSRVLCTMEYFLQGFLRQAGGQVIGQL